MADLDKRWELKLKRSSWSRHGDSTTGRSRTILTGHFADRHALVTGGSKGIGAAIARGLVQRGAGVTLVARRPEPLEATAASLVRARSDACVRTLALDVGDEAAVAAAVPAELAEQPVDILANAAGVAHSGRFTETAAAEFHRQLEVNYFGTLWMVRAVVPHLLARGDGHVVNVGSMASLMGLYSYGAYAPAKFAVYGLSEVLRAELRPRGIEVSILLPPNTDTDQLAAEQASAPPEVRRMHDSSPVLQPDYVAGVLLRGVARRRFEILPGFNSRLVALLVRLSPSVSRAVLDRLVARGGGVTTGRSSGGSSGPLSA